MTSQTSNAISLVSGIAFSAPLGGEHTLSQLQIDLVDRHLELDVVATWLGGNLLAEERLTAKGRSRAALSAYLTVLDRVHRVSSALGLARRQKAVSLNQYLTDTYEDGVHEDLVNVGRRSQQAACGAS